MTEPLLTPEFIRRLDRLELETRRVLGGQVKGERRSKRKGIGMDFADHRHYSRGDDTRHLDWNIYARLERLFIKVFHEEQDLRAHLLLDTSKSMDYGEPNKFLFARRLAAAVAYVGLRRQDRIALSCFDAASGARFGPARGRPHIRRLLEFLGGLEAGGETSLHAACRECAQRLSGRAVVIVISDLLDPAGFEPALRQLVRQSLDVFVIHVLAPQEIEPPLRGHLELRDLESGHKVEVTVNERLLRAYRQHLDALCGAAQSFCLKRGMQYMLVRSDTPIEEVMLMRLRGTGLLKG